MEKDRIAWSYIAKKQTDNPLKNYLFLADKFYPSTRRCSRCGFVKKGDDKIGLDGNMKHKTKHNEYVCYECGAVMDRDENAVTNLVALI